MAQPNKFSVKCFGTGDGWPCADRSHASFLYRLGSTALLVDCGEPIDRSFKGSGLSYETIDSIFISHLHSDHIGGLFMLMQGFWLEGRRKNLDIYLPERAIEPLQRMFETVFIFTEVLPFRLRLLPLPAEGKTLRLLDARVRVFRTTHLDGYRACFAKKYRADFNSYAFLFESGQKRVAHSADLGRPEDLEPLLQQPLDLLVCELAHFRPEDLFGYLQGREIRQVVFVHMARAVRGNLSKVRRLAAGMLPDIPHRFACDGQDFGF